MKRVLLLILMICCFFQGCSLLYLAGDTLAPAKEAEWDKMIEFRDLMIEKSSNYIGHQRVEIEKNLGEPNEIYFNWNYRDGMTYDEAWLYTKLKDKDKYGKTRGYAIRIYFNNNVVGNVEIL